MSSLEAYTLNKNVTNTAKMIAVCKYDAINVAFKPPAIVYTITPNGIKKPAV